MNNPPTTPPPLPFAELLKLANIKPPCVCKVAEQKLALLDGQRNL